MPRDDLFTWRDEDDAAAAVRAAEEARATAARKARVAPHGAVQARRDRLREATHQALLAEVALARVQRGLR